MTTGLVDKDITIDGETVTYNFVQFSTTVALKTLTRLTKILGEPMAIALGGAKADPGEKTQTLGDHDISGSVLGEAVKALSDRLDETEVLSLVKLLAADNVLCNGGKIIFDEHYRGNIKLLFKVFQTALVVQYGNFMGAVKGKSVGAAQPTGIAIR